MVRDVAARACQCPDLAGTSHNAGTCRGGTPAAAVQPGYRAHLCSCGTYTSTCRPKTLRNFGLENPSPCNFHEVVEELEANALENQLSASNFVPHRLILRSVRPKITKSIIVTAAKESGEPALWARAEECLLNSVRAGGIQKLRNVWDFYNSGVAWGTVGGEAIGMLAGLAVLVKMYWQKLRELPGSLSANSRKDKAGDSESPEGQDPA